MINQYLIQENGKGDVAGMKNVHLELKGRFEDGKIIPDSSYDILLLDQMLWQKLKNDIASEKLRVGTKGYIKMDGYDYYRKFMRSIFNIHIYYDNKHSLMQLQADSAKLGTTGVFDKIRIITEDDAIQTYNADNRDTSWKKILDANPLPASIDLEPKLGYMTLEGIDSIRSMLNTQFPGKDIQIPDINNFPGIEKKHNMVYKFVLQ